MNWHPDLLLTPQQIYEAGGPAPRSLERLRMTGDGPPFTRVGARIIRYRARDYVAWLESRTFAHAAEERAARLAAERQATPMQR